MMQDAHTFWPDDRQRRLLQVAMDAEPLPAWSAWCEVVAEDEKLDEGSYRLLPLIYQRLSYLCVDHKRLVAFKPLYDKTWAHNQVLLHQASTVLDAFNKIDIPTIVLKGIPLSILYYQDLGVRPMGDIDLAVPPSKAHQAIQWFIDQGWEPESRDVGGFLRYRHAMSFRKGNIEVDLHWKFFFEATPSTDIANDVWERAQTLDVHGVTTRALHPTDLLLTTLVHGMRWNPVPSFRWMVDAQKIIAAAGDALDWRALVARAKAYRIALRCADALAYLKQEFVMAIPTEAVEALKSGPATWLERAEYRCYQKPSSWSGWNPTMLTLMATQYGRSMHGAGWMRVMTGVPGYLRYRLQGKRIIRRLWRGRA